VNVQVLAGGEIYMALERGAIDATEWVGPHDDEKLGLHKVTKLYYYPGWWEPGPNITVLVNRGEWDRLPEVYQRIFEVACTEASVHMLAGYDQSNPAALERLLKAGVQLRRFSDDLMDAARTATREILEQFSAADPRYRKIHQSWSKARDAGNRWFGTAEAAYSAYIFKK
jgi:TRAP-type mannitol/chloroaromatic compound transport system substrate-binding protein